MGNGKCLGVKKQAAAKGARQRVIACNLRGKTYLIAAGVDDTGQLDGILELLWSSTEAPVSIWLGVGSCDESVVACKEPE